MIAGGSNVRRDGAIAFACIVAAASASWLRYAIDGTLSAKGAAWELWPFAIVGVAGVLGFRAQNAGRLSWRAIVGVAIAMCAVAALALPLTSNDAWSNIAYGRLAAAGKSPFLFAPAALPADDDVRALVDPFWLNTPMVYGPLAALACRAVAVTGSAAGDLAVLKLEMFVAALAAIALAAAAVRGRFADKWARARFVLFAWSPLFVWEVCGQAHNDGLVVVALLGFVLAATRRREFAAIVALAVATAVKFVAAPIAALYIVYVARTRPLRAVALAAVFAAICALAVAPWWSGADTFAAFANHVAPDLPKTSRSIADLFYWMASPLGASAQRVAYGAVVLAGLAACAAIGITAIARARTPIHVIHYALLLYLCAAVLALAWFEPWYVLWALPLALVHPDSRWIALVATFAGLSMATYVVPFDPIPDVIVHALVGAWAIAIVKRRPRRPSPRAPGTRG
jgi:hypothetical protein